MRTLARLVLAMFVTTPVLAQQTLTSPYRAKPSSPIRGLSDKEIEDLQAGRGMGLARVAELNNYPGPRHVLGAVEAGQLHLSPEQLSTVRQLFEVMSGEARRLGDTILREEQALEEVFRTGKMGEAELWERVRRIASLSGELRLVHLRAHLETRAFLTDHQIERYHQLRGYGHDSGSQGDQHPGRH